MFEALFFHNQQLYIYISSNYNKKWRKKIGFFYFLFFYRFNIEKYVYICQVSMMIHTRLSFDIKIAIYPFQFQQ